MTVIIWCLLFFSIVTNHAASTEITVVDTIQPVDSVVYNELNRQNDLFDNFRTRVSATITKDSIRAVNYTHLGDLVARTTIYMPLWQGSLGQRDGIDVMGVLPDMQVQSVNGRPIQSKIGKGMHPLQYDPRAIERLDIVTGSEAIGTMPTIGLVGLQVQSRQFDAAEPYTSMWFHQGAGDLVGGNVVFAQNVSSKVGLSADIRRLGAKGLYKQTDFDAWNIHLQGKFHQSRSSTWLLSYDLATIDADRWSGVVADPYGNADPPENFEVRTIYPRDVYRRHDVALMNSLRFVDDTNLRIVTSLFVVGEAQRADTLGLGGTRVGLTSTASYRTKAYDVRAGLLGMNSYGAVWGLVSANISSKLSIQGSARYDHGSGGSTGLGSSIRFADSVIALKVDASRTTALQSDSSAQLVYLQSFYGTSSMHVQAVLFHHSHASSGLASYGGLMEVTGRIGPVMLSGVLRVGTHNAPSNNRSILMGNVRAVYDTRLITSRLSVGTEFGVISAGHIVQYDPLHVSYASLPMLSAPFQNNGINLFANLEVGTASIRASFENILSTKWYTIAYLPALPRQLRLSIDWTFVD